MGERGWFCRGGGRLAREKRLSRWASGETRLVLLRTHFELPERWPAVRAALPALPTVADPIWEDATPAEIAGWVPSGVTVLAADERALRERRTPLLLIDTHNRERLPLALCRKVFRLDPW